MKEWRIKCAKNLSSTKHHKTGTFLQANLKVIADVSEISL